MIRSVHTSAMPMRDRGRPQREMRRHVAPLPVDPNKPIKLYRPELMLDRDWCSPDKGKQRVEAA